MRGTTARLALTAVRFLSISGSGRRGFRQGTARSPSNTARVLDARDNPGCSSGPAEKVGLLKKEGRGEWWVKIESRENASCAGVGDCGGGAGQNVKGPTAATKMGRRRLLGTRQPECAAADRPTASGPEPLQALPGMASSTGSYWQLSLSRVPTRDDGTNLHCDSSKHGISTGIRSATT
jgi:hypothetical protein